MINHWEMVYGKGAKNDRKQLQDALWLHPLFCKYNRQAENYVSDFTGTSLINQIRKKLKHKNRCTIT